MYETYMYIFGEQRRYITHQAGEEHDINCINPKFRKLS